MPLTRARGLQSVEIFSVDDAHHSILRKLSELQVDHVAKDITLSQSKV